MAFFTLFERGSFYIEMVIMMILWYVPVEDMMILNGSSSFEIF